MRRTAIATFMVGALAALGIAASGQLTPGGGLTRVVLSTTPGNLASGSGTTTAPLDVELHASAPLQGTGSGGSPATLANANYGDVTVAGGTTWSVNALPESRITSLTSDLAAKANTSSLATIATTGAAGDLVSGAVPAARMPAFTGDVTTSIGSVATTIASGVVTNTKLAVMSAGTVKANITGSSAAPSDVSLSALAQATALKLGNYGSGADGSFTADGTATTACLTLVNPVYTANRECAFVNLTVNSGITIKPAGFPLFVNQTLTVNGGGSVNADGNSASASVNGAATWTTTSLLPAGTSGGSSVGVGVGGSGTAANNTSPSLCSAGTAARGVAAIGSSPPGSIGASCQGGGGGAGGSNTSASAGNSGGPGGTVSLATTGLGDLQERQVATSSYLFSASHLGAPSGGGGGGGFTGGGTGGGGGGAGGWMVIHCAHCVITGTASARGGNGGNGNPAVGGTAGGGGGGGGSGGVCIIDTTDLTAPTCSTAGGTGGTGAAAISTGQPGGAGGTGGSGISIAFTGF
jgi:hypothetical protein